MAKTYRDVAYCNECGGRLNLYVVGVCYRCNFEVTGEDPDGAARVRAVEATESDSERTER
jgi:hypothetical protein